MARASKAKRIAAIWVGANILCLVYVQLYLEAMYSSGLRCSLIEAWAPGGNLRDPNGLCQQILARGYLRMPAASQIIPALLTIWYMYCGQV